jgi:hypothetical protein
MLFLSSILYNEPTPSLVNRFRFWLILFRIAPYRLFFSVKVDTAVQLMIEKGFFTHDEFFTKLKQIQAEYQSNAQ